MNVQLVTRSCSASLRGTLQFCPEPYANIHCFPAEPHHVPFGSWGEYQLWRRQITTMVNFTCPFDWVMGCPDEMLFLGVCVRVFSYEVSIWIRRISKVDFPSKCGWPLSNPLRVWIELKVEEKEIHHPSPFFFFSASLFDLGQFILSCCRTELRHDFSGSPAWRRQDVEHLSFCHPMNIFLIINLLLDS